MRNVLLYLEAEEMMSGAKKRELVLQRTEWRRVLPELGVPLNPDEDEENMDYYDNGRPLPFTHPGENKESPREDEHGSKPPQIPNLWPFK